MKKPAVASADPVPAILEAIATLPCKPASAARRNPDSDPKRFWTVLFRLYGTRLRICPIREPSDFVNPDFGVHVDLELGAWLRGPDSAKSEQIRDLFRDAARRFDPGPKSRAIPFVWMSKPPQKTALCGISLGDESGTLACLYAEDDDLVEGRYLIAREDGLVLVDAQEDFGKVLKRIPWAAIREVSLSRGTFASLQLRSKTWNGGLAFTPHANALIDSELGALESAIGRLAPR